jgi:hypothetical protein
MAIEVLATKFLGQSKRCFVATRFTTIETGLILVSHEPASGNLKVPLT